MLDCAHPPLTVKFQKWIPPFSSSPLYTTWSPVSSRHNIPPFFASTVLFFIPFLHLYSCCCSSPPLSLLFISYSLSAPFSHAPGSCLFSKVMDKLLICWGVFFSASFLCSSILCLFALESCVSKFVRFHVCRVFETQHFFLA